MTCDGCFATMTSPRTVDGGAGVELGTCPHCDTVFARPIEGGPWRVALAMDIQPDALARGQFTQGTR